MSEWKAVVSDVPQGLVLALELFNILVNCMDSATKCTLIKLPDDSKLCGVVTMLEGRDAIQCEKPMKFNKELCLGQSSPINTGWGMTRLTGAMFKVRLGRALCSLV